MSINNQYWLSAKMGSMLRSLSSVKLAPRCEGSQHTPHERSDANLKSADLSGTMFTRLLIRLRRRRETVEGAKRRENGMSQFRCEVASARRRLDPQHFPACHRDFNISNSHRLLTPQTHSLVVSLSPVFPANHSEPSS